MEFRHRRDRTILPCGVFRGWPDAMLPLPSAFRFRPETIHARARCLHSMSTTATSRITHHASRVWSPGFSRQAMRPCGGRDDFDPLAQGDVSPAKAGTPNAPTRYPLYVVCGFAVLVFALLPGCSKPVVKPDPNVLAKVGPVEIRVEDF